MKLKYNFLIFCALLAGLWGCSYDSSSLQPVQCDQPGERDGNRECRDGYWVDFDAGDSNDDDDAGLNVGEPDASPSEDTGPAEDTGPDADPCEPITADQWCDDQGYMCGSWTFDDGCDGTETATCGSCEGEDDCDELAGVCVGPTCDDGVQNGQETDIDCGGPDCDPCEQGSHCEVGGDCLSGVCGDLRTLDGLIALYHFDEGSGDIAYDQTVDYVDAALSLDPVLLFGQGFDGQQLLDETGNGHHGAVMGGTEWVDFGGPTNRLPGYLSHDADDSSYTEIAHDPALDLNEAMTIAYWRRHHGDWDDNIGVDLSKGNYAYAIKNRGSSQQNLEWDLRGGPGANHAQTGGGGVTPNTWQFVVLTWDGQYARMFVDDMADPKGGPTEIEGPLGTNEQNLLLAAQNYPEDNVRRYTNIDITGLALFDRALDLEERQLLSTASHALDLGVYQGVNWGDDYAEFDGGMMRLSNFAPVYDRIFEGDQAFTVETWVEAESTDQTGPARIVSLSLNPSERNFTLAAEEERLKVRHRYVGLGPNGLPAIFDEDQGVSTELEHYVITVADGEARLYRNGELQNTSTGADDLDVSQLVGSWDRNFPLLVGGELDGGEPSPSRAWRGKMHMLAIYGRAIDEEEVANHFIHGEVPDASPLVCGADSP